MRPVTALLPQVLVTRSMRKRSEEPMIRELKRLSKAHSMVAEWGHVAASYAAKWPPRTQPKMAASYAAHNGHFVHGPYTGWQDFLRSPIAGRQDLIYQLRVLCPLFVLCLSFLPFFHVYELKGWKEGATAGVE